MPPKLPSSGNDSPVATKSPSIPEREPTPAPAFGGEATQVFGDRFQALQTRRSQSSSRSPLRRLGPAKLRIGRDQVRLQEREDLRQLPKHPRRDPALVIRMSVSSVKGSTVRTWIARC